MTAQDLAEAWTAFWNGELERAGDLLTADFRIHFGGADDASVRGDDISGPQQMAAYVRDFQAARAGLRFAVDAPPIADDSGFALRWSARRPGVSVSGIDVLRLAGERIAEVWSITGARRFPA